MILKVSVPNRFQFKAVPTFKTLMMPKQGEIHYIGGADILPAPLDNESEARVIAMLGGEDDQSAKSELIEHNLRLVVYIAKKFDNTSVGVEDLISIGTIGLIKAINTFNPGKNIKLATYDDFKCILARNCEGTEQLRKDTDARHRKTVRRSVRKICNRSSENRLQKSEKKDGKRYEENWFTDKRRRLPGSERDHARRSKRTFPQYR